MSDLDDAHQCDFLQERPRHHAQAAARVPAMDRVRGYIHCRAEVPSACATAAARYTGTRRRRRSSRRRCGADTKSCRISAKPNATGVRS
jgi:hypothetical protein